MPRRSQPAWPLPSSPLAVCSDAPNNASRCGPQLCWRPPTANRTRRSRHRGGSAIHRAQVAPLLVCSAGSGLVGRCETSRSPTGVQPRADRPGQGGGLQATAGLRATVVTLVVPGAGRTGDHRRDLRADLAGNGTPLAVRGRAQTVAVSVMDLHHRSRLRRQSSAGAGPVRPHLARHAVGPERLRHLRRREDLHPGPLPLPSHPRRRARPGDPGQP